MAERVAGSLLAQLVIGVLGAFVSALLTAEHPSTVTPHMTVTVSWPTVIIAGLVGGGGVLTVIWLLGFLHESARYRRSGYKDDNWEAIACPAGNDIMLELRRKQDAMPVSFTEHGDMECVVKAPNGSIQTFSDSARDLHGVGDSRVFTHYQNAAPGTYEVRWYGSKDKRHKFYEITRDTFVL